MKIDPNAAKPAQRKLLIQPGERYEVIIDFNDPTWLALNPAFSGSLVLKNTARTPFPKGAAPQGTTLGQMMKLVVAPTAPAVPDTSYDPASGVPLRTGGNAIKRLAVNGTLAVTPAKTRALTLNEVMGMPMTAVDPVTGLTTAYPGGPLEILVNNTKWLGKDAMADPRPDFTWITVNGVTTGFSEMPQEGDTEVWEIINLTADAHPIHLHLVQFQVLNRQDFNVSGYSAAYAQAFGTNLAAPLLPGCVAGAFCAGYGPPLDYATGVPGKLGGNPDITPHLQGPPRPPLPSEAGWKDTAINYPGTVTRYAVRWAPNALRLDSAPGDLAFPFDPSGERRYNFVWHCHIIDHEDNEMMRPDLVQVNPLAPAPALRRLVKGVSY